MVAQKFAHKRYTCDLLVDEKKKTFLDNGTSALCISVCIQPAFNLLQNSEFKLQELAWQKRN
jgi:hypothetical protein